MPLMNSLLGYHFLPLDNGDETWELVFQNRRLRRLPQNHIIPSFGDKNSSAFLIAKNQSFFLLLHIFSMLTLDRPNLRLFTTGFFNN